MFKVGDYLVVRKDVCKITKIKVKHYEDTDYYVLTQTDDPSLRRELPVNSDQIRPLIAKSKVKELIKKIPEVQIINVANDRFIDSEYKKLIKFGKHEDLISIIKTTYLRNKKRMEKYQKTGAIDANYLKQAEKQLYTEFSVVLDISYDEVKKIIIDAVIS